MKTENIFSGARIILLCGICVLLFACHGSRSGSVQDNQNEVPRKQGHYTQRQPGLRELQQAPHKQSGQHSFPMGRPYNFAEFKERYRTVGTTPEGAVRMYFDALYSYIEPVRQQEGAKMLRYSMHERQGWEKSPALATFVSRLKDPSYHYIFRSFAQGTSPQNNYEMNPDSYQLMFARTKQATDYVQVTIKSSGAANPRPVHVQRFEDGLWYVVNNHGTYTEVRKPFAFQQK